MTNTEIIRAIRNEIERLKATNPSEYNYQNAEGYVWALDDILSFLSTLESEKHVPADLEEAAEKYLDKLFGKGKHQSFYKELFITGGKWQKEQDDRLVDIIYQQGIEKGKDDMKEQMMKEAVEADIMLTLHDKTGDVSLHTGYLPKELGIKCDDKVRIIIVKEGEQC